MAIEIQVQQPVEELASRSTAKMREIDVAVVVGDAEGRAVEEGVLARSSEVWRTLKRQFDLSVEDTVMIESDRDEG